jgi:hypothetical protein
MKSQAKAEVHQKPVFGLYYFIDFEIADMTLLSNPERLSKCDGS